VPADDPLEQALVAEVVEPAVLAVPLAGGVDEGEAAGRSGLQEALLQGHGQVLGEADADEAAGGYGVAVLDAGHGLPGGDHLVAAQTDLRLGSSGLARH